MNQWLAIFLGGGGALGGFATILGIWYKHKGSRLDWYDKTVEAQNEISNLRTEIYEMKMKQSGNLREIADLKKDLADHKQLIFEKEKQNRILQKQINDLEKLLNEKEK